MYVLMHPIRNIPNCYPKRHADDGRTPSFAVCPITVPDYPAAQLAPHRPNWYQLDPRSNENAFHAYTS
jgi:hypothetical protein